MDDITTDDNKSTFDPATVPYLRQADSIFRNGFEDEEMKNIFLENFFEEIVGSEVKLSFMKSSSFILEQFVGVATPKHLLQLLKAYNDDIIEVAGSQQASHVVQKTLKQIVLLRNNDPDNSTWSDIDATLHEISSLICEDIPSWLTHVHQSHVARSMFSTLGGVILATKDSGNDVIIPTLPQPSMTSLKVFVDEVCKLKRKNLVEILTNQSGTPSVSILLRVCNIRSEALIRSLCGKILKACDEGTLLILSKDRTGSHLVESLVEFGDVETCRKIYEIISTDEEKLVELACHPVANFVVQKLIENDKIEFDGIFSILSKEMLKIIHAGRPGVVVKLGEGCVRSPTTQSTFVTMVMKAFNCDDDEKKKLIVPLVASLSSYDKMFSKTFDPDKPPTFKVAYHGSLLLQTILKFDKIFVFVKSFLEIPSSHTVTLACSAPGSHLVDAFFSSEKVRAKRKLKWIEKTKDVFFKIAMDKYGSRVLENIWRQSSIKMKIIIAESLVPHESSLTNDQHGKHIFRKFAIRQFHQRNEDWKSFQVKIEKKRKMFQDFLPDEQQKKKKKV
nr:nucleolar protein 9 isoform X2 [Ciona intestinalis]|eukprot:XP_002125348.1 nucleolar protein 9 isoform X2 [Ciona intestinalis]